MSSRSFRRRNNRRKHNKPSTGADPNNPAQRGPAGQDRPSEPGQRGNQPRGPRRDNQRQGPHGRLAPGARRPSEPFVSRSEPLVFPDCPICRQPVRELPSALTHKETGQPAHFDCIMKELRDSNELAPQERICYLGGGCFGILEFRQPGGPGKFVIRKRIQYEEKEAVQEWKKPLLMSL